MLDARRSVQNVGDPPLLVKRRKGNPHRHEHLHVGAGHPGARDRRHDEFDGLLAAKQMGEKVPIHSVPGQERDPGQDH